MKRSTTYYTFMMYLTRAAPLTSYSVSLSNAHGNLFATSSIQPFAVLDDIFEPGVTMARW